MSNAQDLYNAIKSDRLDPENALVTRNVGGGDASAANQTALNVLTGAINETAPAIDTASSGLNGRLQRIAQRLTTLITQIPASLGVKTQALSLSAGVAQDKNVWTQLTAPGSTAAFSMVGYKRATIAVLIAAINTSLVVRVEGSMDGTNWFNLSPTNTDTTITSNGTYGFNVEAAIDNIRLTFVSETGGTAVTVDGTVRVSA